MKHRTLAFLLVAILLACMLSACSSPIDGKDPVVFYEREPVPITYPTYVLCDSNYIGPRLPSDSTPFSFSHNDFESDIAPKTKTISFLGKEYTADYKYTFQPIHHSFYVDWYVSNDISFHIENGTDRITSISFNDNSSDPPADVEAPREYAIALATQMAEQLVDLSSYEMSVTEEDSYNAGQDLLYTLYEITFSVMHEDLPTSDSVVFSITSAGFCQSVTFGELGGFDRFTNTDCNNATVDDLAYSRLLEKGANDFPGLQLTDFKVLQRKLILTSDGRILAFSEIELNWVNFNEMKTEKNVFSVYTDFGPAPS